MLQLFHHVQIGAGKHAIAADIGIDDSPEANGNEETGKGQDFFVAPFHPATGSDRIAFGVEGND